MLFESGGWHGCSICQVRVLLRSGVDFVREPPAGMWPAVSVCRIPPKSGSFFRRFTTPVHDRVVYITYGMSSSPMQVPSEQAQIYPARIELIAYCGEPTLALMMAKTSCRCAYKGWQFCPFKTRCSSDLCTPLPLMTLSVQTLR